MSEGLDLRGILSGEIKICVGLKGRTCNNVRRVKGRLCKACHRLYMKQWRAGEGSRARVVDGYDFNQDSGVSHD